MYLKTIWRQFKKLHWWEKSIILLFIIRFPLYIILSKDSLPQFENYPINIAVWHILTATIELASVYSIYRRCLKDNEGIELAILLCFIGVGHVIDKFTEAAINSKVSELVWILVVVVYVYVTWKKTYNGREYTKQK